MYIDFVTDAETIINQLNRLLRSYNIRLIIEEDGGDGVYLHVEKVDKPRSETHG